MASNDCEFWEILWIFYTLILQVNNPVENFLELDFCYNKVPKKGADHESLRIALREKKSRSGVSQHDIKKGERRKGRESFSGFYDAIICGFRFNKGFYMFFE